MIVNNQKSWPNRLCNESFQEFQEKRVVYICFNSHKINSPQLASRCDAIYFVILSVAFTAGSFVFGSWVVPEG